jgi:hypothetical protein
MWSNVPEEGLIPEAMIPSQFRDIWHCSRAISPERALAISVLEQAVFDLNKYRYATRRRHQRMYMEAYNWVASDDGSWPYSFVNLCDALDLTPEWLRPHLLDQTGAADQTGTPEESKPQTPLAVTVEEAA